MKISVIGAGPAGLYFSYLMKRDNPDHDIRVYEQNPKDATFGFGVVFSERALEFLRDDDQGTYDFITPRMEAWDDLTIVHKDEAVPIDGNGFTAIGRLEFLNLLQVRCDELDIPVDFNQRIESPKRFRDADVIIGADGINSVVRRSRENDFGTKIDTLDNPFAWYGTTKLFDTLTLTFRRNDDGVFVAHHYRYSPTMSTFIVETDKETFERAGFKEMNEADTIAYCEEVFAPDLDGHSLISNKSEWRWFPQIWNETWFNDNMVLLGDALHTAHFSIGSGTRLAMEDAIALYKGFKAYPEDVTAAFKHYEANRRPPLEKLVNAAINSAKWYERMNELMEELDPYEFARSYMTRTGRVSTERLQKIAPRFMTEYLERHPEDASEDAGDRS